MRKKISLIFVFALTILIEQPAWADSITVTAEKGAGLTSFSVEKGLLGQNGEMGLFLSLEKNNEKPFSLFLGIDASQKVTPYLSIYGKGKIKTSSSNHLSTADFGVDIGTSVSINRNVSLSTAVYGRRDGEISKMGILGGLSFKF